MSWFALPSSRRRGAAAAPAAVAPDVAWHALDAGAARAELDARLRDPADPAPATDRASGLSDAEAARRRSRVGRNVLPPPPRRHPLRRLLAQFANALIGFLLIAAAVAAVLGHAVDAAVIVGVVLVNAIVGFVQEGRAEQALGALGSLLAPAACVLRGGERRRVDAADLVPGDVVLIEAGDRVPADLRLLRARGLLIDEAILTGESVAAAKRERSVPAAAPLAERSSMAWSGTLVAAGQGRGLVVATGEATEMGRIGDLLRSIGTLRTPLLDQIDRFGRRFALIAALSSALLFAFAVFARGYEAVDALMLVVALAVGVIPESLPAVITITLAIGVRRMAARHAIVRRLPAVETLGATSVICTDKTGTLTRNEMTVRRLSTIEGDLFLDGVGYVPVGTLHRAEAPQTPVAAPDAARRLLEIAVLCNDARLGVRDAHWQVDGDPMEGALIAAAIKAGLEPAAEHARQPRLDAIPFDARHRTMATLHAAAGGAPWIAVKGAPEALLALSGRQLASDGGSGPLDRAYWDACIARAAAAGERVLGFAYRPAPDPASLPADAIADLVFVGIAGLVDPPRAEAAAAVAECASAGIAVKMITGDHAVTAAAIAHQLGLADAGEVLTGADLDRLDDAALRRQALRAGVFARTSPEHKLRVVRALQADGAVVAMTGDGVNDAPSLKQADVGIAMGRKGTEAARQAAQIVLTDDNFASIVAAVHEGRTVYDNIRKVIAWTLPTNGGEALAIVAAIAFGLALPMTAVQILWINLILTITLGLVLAFEPAEPGTMTRPPRAARAPLLSPFMLWRLVLVSVLFTAGVLGVHAWSIAHGLDAAAARTVVVNAVCVMEIGYLFNVRYLHGSSLTLHGARGTPAVLLAVAAVVLAQLAFTYAPWLQALFDTRPLGLRDGLVALCAGIVLMAILEIEKRVLRRLGVFESALRPTPARMAD
ncbi:MAG TPA: HAD-IC family P-type ATPase [Dokdonella sp.]|uniref:HAD-IC family P-type ATPase n=1 Tax=Dokdonella sp. TaxID=2291710 RepID=UPI002C143372|nr:HAD-IC family P-type ATPase [Dokdonella sp.]HUD40682.1 HAD-IC family P-type ATPase [Dokdonella sp.]